MTVPVVTTPILPALPEFRFPSVLDFSFRVPSVQIPDVTFSGIASFHPSVTATAATLTTASAITYTASQVNSALQYTWHNSPTPMWSSILETLKNYEALYGLSSNEVYDKYKSNRPIGVRIPEIKLRDWMDAFVQYKY
jgi:hypothetical protein